MGAPAAPDTSEQQRILEQQQAMQKRKDREVMQLRLNLLRRQQGGVRPGATSAEQTLG
jgi:aryl-alcohol dehydrogenase-like predicted oxidoreductase